LIAAAASGGAAVFAGTSLKVYRDGRPRPLAPADAAVVFGAAVWESGASPELIARIDRAAELHTQGFAPLILCCGGRSRDVSEGMLMRDLLTERGVPDRAILVDDRAATTRQALEAVARWAHGRWRVVLLVSSPYHMHRLATEARRRGLCAVAAPASLQPLAWPVRSEEDWRLLGWQLTRHVREVLAVWWYALPLRLSTIETRKAGKAMRSSAQLAELVRDVEFVRDSNQAERPPGQETWAETLARPVAAEVTSGFGWRATRHHDGIDFAASHGVPVFAAAAGTVVYSGELDVYGRVIALSHEAGLATVYSHLSRIDIARGQTVTPGQPIGRAGSTGNTFGPHLHFEVRVNGAPVDPTPYLGLAANGGLASPQTKALTGLAAARRVAVGWLRRRRGA
jgi:uncharacterized SAM-binding protein YcdF (DUF218 family)